MLTDNEIKNDLIQSVLADQETKIKKITDRASSLIKTITHGEVLRKEVGHSTMIFVSGVYWGMLLNKSDLDNADSIVHPNSPVNPKIIVEDENK